NPLCWFPSELAQLHFITVEFPRKVAIQKISIYFSWPQNDSYNPSTLTIRAGTGPSDLQDVRVASLEKPDGWITFDVLAKNAACNLCIVNPSSSKPVHAYVLQVIVVQNHMSGKDTHMRGLRVLGPQEYASHHIC
ncbi:galactose-binding like protein, partial [Rhizopogon vinicolor AM-OR11-026]